MEIEGYHSSDRAMKSALMVLILISLTLLGGIIFLAMWDIPAPVTSIERDISNEKRSK